jgi:hypothetical protein
MAEPLTRDQFNIAVADAVTGVLNVYREVDAMFRELNAALAATEPRIVPFTGRKPLVPGAGGKNPDGSYLKSYRAWIYAPAAELEEDEGEEDEEDSEEDEEEEATKKGPLSIAEGTGLVAVRATIFDRGVTSFEPNLVVGTLLRCRVEPVVPASTELKIRRGHFKRVLRDIDKTSAAKTVKTTVPVTVGTVKNKHKLVFDVPSAWRRYPLFDVTPATIQDIAKAIRASVAQTT